MSVRYTRNAIDDLDQISSYLADRNPAAADRFLGAIADVTARLDRFPYSALQTEMPNIRAATVLRFPCSRTLHRAARSQLRSRWQRATVSSAT